SDGRNFGPFAERPLSHRIGYFGGRLHGSDKSETALIQRWDKLLFGPGIADSPSCRADARAQGRLRNGAALPHRFDQLILGDDTVVVANKVNQQVEDLRLEGHELTCASQLAPRNVDFKSGKTKIQDGPRMACTPQHAST